MGVSAESIVQDEQQLRARLPNIFERYDGPALVERFVEGREVTVGVVGNLVTPTARRVPEDEDAPRILKGLHFFPSLEVDMSAYPPEEAGIYTSRIKVEMAHDFHFLCPAPLSDDLVADLQWWTAATFRVTGCLDVARVDFRLDASDGDKPYILEVNPLPGLNPGYSDLCVEAATDGWTYEELINEIVNVAAERYGLI